ncbi:MAG: hypothetical protein EZS28_048679 [Streblomastix strix]|uniref:Uncharacterized protein n=1 Tax=Streblomastix strix TaxID=222440 RepID=A0A5J4TBN3_9EUKA|nr:MAG: hypothetical protein EZS28_048679 [Streblomastix strix]
MSKNSVKPEPSEPELFVDFETPKFTTKTPVTTVNEQPEMGDEIGKFLQSELQPTLQDIERQLTPWQTVIERTQALMTKVLEAMTVPNKTFDSKRIQFDKILQSEQALAFNKFKIGEGILAHMYKQQEEQLAIDVLSLMQNKIIYAGSTGHCEERHGEQRRDRNYEFTVWNPIAGKSKSQNEKISLVNTFSNLSLEIGTNAELEREPGA